MEHSDDEEQHLTHDQMEKLAQLQDLTGIEDTAVCRALLESNNWDLEGTAREHLGLPEQPPQDNHNQPPPPPPPVAQNNERELPAGRALWRIRPTNLLSLLMFVLSLPLRIVSSGMDGVWSFVTSLLGFPPSREPVVTNAAADVASFIAYFEQLYGRDHPPFFQGSYKEVLEEAKKELKFLLVYLHSDDHQATETFCTGTLRNPRVIEYIQANMLFWGCSIRLPEGYKVSDALNENTYPFLAVIVLRQNRMVVVGRQEGDIEPGPLVDWLEATVREYEAFIVAERAERDERNFNREIRSEQEAAFAETLRQDQEREQQRQEEERQRQEAEERERKEEEERMRRQEEEEDRKEKIRKMKIELLDEIPEEPDSSCGEAIRILIKLPGGQRLERRFLPTHSLKHLYYFVFCHPESPDEFDIVSNYPKRTLPCRPSPDQPDPPTLAEAGFAKSEMLFVNDLDA